MSTAKTSLQFSLQLTLPDSVTAMCLRIAAFLVLTLLVGCSEGSGTPRQAVRDSRVVDAKAPGLTTSTLAGAALSSKDRPAPQLQSPTSRVAGSPTPAVSTSAKPVSDAQLDANMDQYEKRYPEGVEVARGASEDHNMVWRLWARKIDGGAGVEFASEYRASPESGKVTQGGGAGSVHTKRPIQVMGTTTKPPAWAWIGTVTTDVASVRVHTPAGDQVVRPFDRELFDRRYFVVFLDVRPQYFVAFDAAGNELGRDNLGT